VICDTGSDVHDKDTKSEKKDEDYYEEQQQPLPRI
jgi:hypothetical protein